MGNNEIQNIWKKLETGIANKPTRELEKILSVKTKNIIRKFLYMIILSALISLGLLIFLSVTILNRQADILYVLNNLALAILSLFMLYHIISSWNKLQNKQLHQPLNNWLKYRISLFKKWQSGKYRKMQLIMLPVFYVLLLLSIHVYFEKKPFTEVMQSGESIAGLIIALPAGLFVSYFVAAKIRKYFQQKLELLEAMEQKLENV